MQNSGSMCYTVFVIFTKEGKRIKKASKKKEQEMSSMNKEKNRLSVLCLQFPTDFSNTEKLC